MTGFAPGPWLRACALLAAAGAVLAVVSGEAHLGAAHRTIAALAAPPLAALLATAWISHRRLVPAILGSSALFATAAVFLLVAATEGLKQAGAPAWSAYLLLGFLGGLGGLLLLPRSETPRGR